MSEPIKQSQSDERQAINHYVVRSETNQRENNEDSFQVIPMLPPSRRAPIMVLAVADGMGGHAYGEEVSREGLRRLSLSLFEQLSVGPVLNQLTPPSPLETESISRSLMDALRQTDSYVRRMVEVNRWGKAGSTVVAAVIVDNLAVVANLGDSPCFHYMAADKRLVKVTDDHTVAGVLLRAGMITPEMARYHEGRSRLEFFLGRGEMPRDEPVHQITLAAGDHLLLCSDGVSGLVPLEKISEILSDPNASAERMAQDLLQAALDSGETDNQTLILWTHPGHKEQAVDPFASTLRINSQYVTPNEGE